MSSGLETVSRPFSFAVVGDTHFADVPVQQAFAWKTHGTRPLDADKYVENVHYALTPMLETLRALEPDFVVMTGDLCEGALSHVQESELRSAVGFLARSELQFIYTRGNHDTAEAYGSAVLPRVERVLSRELQHSYYSFEVAGCRMVILDSTSWEDDPRQAAWLEHHLAAAHEAGERVFVFGHHPVWPVARAFFSDLAFTADVSRLVARYPVDAYFCGHTHNQSVILKRTEGTPVLQCMSAPIGLAEELPTPLDRVQATLIDQDELRWAWSGYLENTAPGWFMVHVGETSVEVRWHHLNRGIESIVAWREAGQPHRLWEMAHPDDARLLSSDLEHLRRAHLRFCAWDAMRPGKRVRLNGVPVGDLPYGAQFAPRRMDIPDSVLPHLDLVNRIEIDAPGVEASTIGNLLIEAVLPGGRVVRTRPTGQIFTWSDRWDAWGTTRLEKVMPGRPIRCTLSFR